MERPRTPKAPESRWTLSQVAGLSGGRLLPESAGGISFGFSSISLDSRTLRAGDFFVALRGETHDGHAHLAEAEARGALGALVDHPLPATAMPQVVVEDSLIGWQRWGAAHRTCFPGLRVLGLTGSSGKTTSKDLTARLLAGLGRVSATEGNRNNHVGVPWTLLGISAEDRFAVVEMGMNHPGEIARLSRLVSPTAALITDVGTAHVGYLGSREAILQAKLEILEGMSSGSPVVLKYDPWVLDRLPERVRRRPLKTFGLEDAADWHPVGPVEWSLAGTGFDLPRFGRVRLSLLGPGALLSSLAALAAVESLGCDPAPLVSSLESVPPRPLRMAPRTIAEVQWVLDCYNASPESTRLAIGFLREVRHSGRRILVLGALGELGEHSEAIHQDLGRRAGAIEIVLFVGDEARPAFQANREAALTSQQADWVADVAAAAEWLKVRLRPHDLVLLKGSRRIGLEKILELLYAAPQGKPEMRGEGR
jgi:UDP-N-acetylmuramoyl-tripeptide--D-alanyl-D-alanine ligase